MNIYLKELSPDDDEKYYNLLMMLSGYDDVYAKPFPDTDVTYEDYKHFLSVRKNLSEGKYEGRNPVTTYWVMDGETPVGYATLKHIIDENKPGGHFGLCLLKEYQNKGLGTIVSGLLSEKAYYDLGLKEVIFTSKKENIQSQKSVEHIGAKFYSEHDGYMFYKHNLEELFKERGNKK